MKKIVITIFVLPTELDDLQRVLIDLNRASKFIEGNNYELYISLSTDDYLVDWTKSKVDKQFFIDKFNSLKPLTDWANKSTLQIRDEILGALSNKIYSYNESQTATHFIWLDTDIYFDDKILYYIENSIDVLYENNNSIDKYIITPEIVRYWDVTWDCLVNERYLNTDLDYCKTNNPILDSGYIDDVSIEYVNNNIIGQPKMKFGAGWFTCVSKPLLDRIQLPSSLGHYGPDDTFIMWAAEKINSTQLEIYQFKLKNYIVCENYFYKNNEYLKSIIHMIDRKDEFKNKAYSAFNDELNRIN